ncbi:uncharacterized protein N7459_006455 [Penicillium hispanicum]|uniref:uncharacterized protein n=1 Tax=Penicillium hispanicum TaxID=1080232 RepID=UPI002540F5E3|nr:uncharacterized protein N7459_006455 [Penicillium hispanicum]KAJ5577491.1 hypothetical protein N7459_006455 [Penicillium hispanicum]
MPVPNWLPEPTESWRPGQKICLLDNHSTINDLPDKEDPPVKEPLELWIKKIDGWTLEEVKVVVRRDDHPALGRWYMTTKDDPNAHRRYTVWVGFDLSRFGSIRSESLFLRRLKADALAENIFAQDTIPMVDGPPRAFWMEMYGYFGNLYEAEGRKGLIRATKKHIELLTILFERGDIKFKSEVFARGKPDLAEDEPDWADHNNYLAFTLSKPRALIFPEFEQKQIHSGNSVKRSSNCVHA